MSIYDIKQLTLVAYFDGFIKNPMMPNRLTPIFKINDDPRDWYISPDRIAHNFVIGNFVHDVNDPDKISWLKNPIIPISDGILSIEQDGTINYEDSYKHKKRWEKEAQELFDQAKQLAFTKRNWEKKRVLDLLRAAIHKDESRWDFWALAAAIDHSPTVDGEDVRFEVVRQLSMTDLDSWRALVDYFVRRTR